jgi:hypothetical protein
MSQGTVETRSMLGALLLAGAVLLLCGAHPLLAPVDHPVARLVSRERVDVVAKPIVVTADLDEIMRDSIVAVAEEQVGVRYVFGGASPGGFDCSGFVRYVLSMVHLPLPRTARQQALTGVAIGRDRLMPGDLLTFGKGPGVSHVGIYLGDGRFAHASSVAGHVVVSRIDRRVTGRVVPLRGARRVVAIASGD